MASGYSATVVFDHTPDPNLLPEPVPFAFLIQDYQSQIAAATNGKSTDPIKPTYSYVLGGSAAVALKIGADSVVTGAQRTFGLNVEQLSLTNPPGQYSLTLSAITPDGISDSLTAVLSL